MSLSRQLPCLRRSPLSHPDAYLDVMWQSDEGRSCESTVRIVRIWVPSNCFNLDCQTTFPPCFGGFRHWYDKRCTRRPDMAICSTIDSDWIRLAHRTSSTTHLPPVQTTYVRESSKYWKCWTTLTVAPHATRSRSTGEHPQISPELSWHLRPWPSRIYLPNGAGQSSHFCHCHET